MHTPEFLAWAVEHVCPLRGGQDGSDPERIERQLRAAREVSDARREGRVLEGYCLDPPDGFRIDEALAIYGGEAAVRSACGGCPANVQMTGCEHSFTGCYGQWPVPDDAPRFLQAIDEAMGLAQEFPITTPGWYGLWLASPVDGPALAGAVRTLEAMPEGEWGLPELLFPLTIALERGSRVHVLLYPRGRVEGAWWNLVPHCPQCRAAWGEAGRRHCSVCGYRGHPAPQQKRHARGRRPYFSLGRLVGAAQAADLVTRYEARRAQSGSQRPAHSPPLAGPPGNP